MGILGLGRIGESLLCKNSTQHSSLELSYLLIFLSVIVFPGIAIAERLAPFKVKKFIYTDVEPRPELASAINAEYGKKCHELRRPTSALCCSN